MGTVTSMGWQLSVLPLLPVRDPQGTIRLYTKGADTVILARLRSRGPSETFTERALDVSPTPARGGLGWSLLLALGWVPWGPLLLSSHSGFRSWLFFAPFCSRSFTCMWDRG